MIATTTSQSPCRRARGLLASCVAAFAAMALMAAPALADPSEEFGIQPGTFTAGVTNALGQPDTQAGSHPYEANTQFVFNTRYDEYLGKNVPAVGVKDVVVELPPGFAGDPRVAGQCTEEQIYTPKLFLNTTQCPAAAQVGEVTVDTDQGFFRSKYTVPVYNMVPQPGQVAVFGFSVLGTVIHVVASVRTDGDYGITTTASQTSQALLIYGVSLTLWGSPADPAYDAKRGARCLENEFTTGKECEAGGEPAGMPVRPFVSNPTNCTSGPPVTTLKVNSWPNPGVVLPYTTTSPPTTGCNELAFNPSIEARPTTNQADSPSGLEFDLDIPQSDDPDGLATAHLKDAVVTLPPGLTVNPSSANGLDACSPAQIGLTTPVGQADASFDKNPAACPDGSKLGTVEVLSVLDHPLKGSVYLASQNQNPFGSLLALYLTIEDPETGIVAKLPGEVKADPQSGQLTASFADNPQLPVESLEVDFFGGARGALRTPPTCGSFTATANLTPWSTPEGADASRTSTFAVSQGAGGGACPAAAAQAPNKPSFSAGTVNPSAGLYTPFVLKLARADGSQEIKAIDTTLPKGLLGKLAGTTYCSEASLAAASSRAGRAEQASASCPASSRVGSVEVAAGAGPAPYYAQGNAYLAGPYKGAPLSLAVITPAVAGPFDLGNVLVRVALQVDPESAQIRAVSDPIPTILQGIPLDVRSISLRMDRPSFTLNPTSCRKMAVQGAATSIFNQIAELSSPFQVGDCGLLGFKPKLAIKLKGGTKRSDYPALTATLTARPGDANIGRTVVALPRSEFLAQNHIKTICTRVQYAANACPPGSIYGSAKAFSPLLDQPLEGPVYLRSSNNPLPDLVASLNGQIDVDLVGRIDSVNGGIRSSFDAVPDAPVTKFVLSMQGGKKGLLENSRNLCATVNRATVEMDGQNGKTYDSRPVVQNACKKKAKKKGGKGGGKGGKNGKRG